ncbi:MAG: DNA primase [Lachnospiraceae bacterium]|nr:DNA primase [Lachnospiraceae bacterium]
MYYPEEVIQQVIDRNDIEDVVSSCVELKKSGSNLVGLCPFHNEKTPSFTVSPNKRMFYCFGCGVGGNVISFVMRYENMDFQEALKYLAERGGVTLPESRYSREDREKSEHRQLMLDANREAAVFYYKNLYSPKGIKGLKYLKEERRLSDETIKKFGLGFSEITDSSLVKHLKTKGFADKVLIDAGLALFDEKRGLRDRFWNRVMFPIMDMHRKVIGFGGRVMGDSKPKYLNTSESPIFDKSRNLFGLNYARGSRANNFIICEGYMDVISMHQAGFDQAVASLGTAFTNEHAAMLERITQKAKKKILLAYDSDGAGVNAALRAIDMLRDVGIMPRVINMKPYKDPDEFIKNLGPEEFQKRIDEAENGFMYILRQTEADFDMSDPEGKTSFEKNIAMLLCTLNEGAERDNYAETVSRKYNITMENLRKLMVFYSTGIFQTQKRPSREDLSNRPKVKDSGKNQKLLLGWISNDPELYPQISSIVKPEDFDEGVLRESAERLFSDIQNGTINIPAMIAAYEDPESQSEAASIFGVRMIMPETKEERSKAFTELVEKVKRNSYSRWAEASAGSAEDMIKAIEMKKALEKLKDLKLDVK